MIMKLFRIKMAGGVACAAAILYALPHFWWGMGFSFAFPGDFQTRSDEFWTQAIGYWGMGIAAVLAAGFALRFVSFGRGKRQLSLLFIIPAGLASIGLTLWGFIYFAMQYLLAVGRVVSAPAFAAQDAHPMFVWGYFWYGLFLVWGLALGAAAYYTYKAARNNR